MVVGFSSNERFLALLVNHLSGPFQESFGCSTLLVHPRRSQNQSWEDFEASFSFPFQSLCVFECEYVCVHVSMCVRECVFVRVFPFLFHLLSLQHKRWVSRLPIDFQVLQTLSLAPTHSHAHARLHTHAHTPSLYTLLAQVQHRANWSCSYVGYVDLYSNLPSSS